MGDRICRVSARVADRNAFFCGVLGIYIVISRRKKSDIFELRRGVENLFVDNRLITQYNIGICGFGKQLGTGNVFVLDNFAELFKGIKRKVAVCFKGCAIS